MPSQQQTGTITTATGTVVWPSAGANTTGYGLGTDPYLILQVSGTYAGIQGVIEGSMDGTSFDGVTAARMAFPALEWGTLSLVDNSTRVWQVPVGPYAQIQWRNTARTSGTLNVRMMSSPVSVLPYPASLLSGPVDQGEWTYSASFAGLAAAASCTDLVQIFGSATRTVKIKKITINGAATAAAATPIVIAKYSTASSGGTPATGAALPVAVPLDSNAPAATATFNSFTANPATLGTLVGNVVSFQGAVLALAAPVPANILTIDCVSLFGPNGLVLRGTSQYAAINLNGGSPGSGNQFGGEIVWNESA